MGSLALLSARALFHLAQAIAQAAILQGHKVLYRETHILLEEVAEATLDGTRKQYMEAISGVALLIIDDFGMRKLPQTAAEDLLEIVMRRYERASTLLTSNRPVDDWGKLLADVAAVGAMLDPKLECEDAVWPQRRGEDTQRRWGHRLGLLAPRGATWQARLDSHASPVRVDRAQCLFDSGLRAPPG